MQGNIFDNKNWTRRGTRNEKGTGFGLSLSKEFIERMNGRIFFTSKEGKGSSFFMEMPLKEGSAKTISEMKSDKAKEERAEEQYLSDRAAPDSEKSRKMARLWHWQESQRDGQNPGFPRSQIGRASG